MLIKFDIEIDPKITGCGYLWESFDAAAPQMDHALCIMPWPAVPHYHEHMTECYEVRSGMGSVYVGEERTFVERGAIIRIPPGQVHYTFPFGSHTPLELLVYNAPAWNSFEVPDFVELEEGRPEWADIYFNLRGEVSLRNRKQWPNAGMLAGKHWKELTRMLCLKGYEDYFDQAFGSIPENA